MMSPPKLCDPPCVVDHNDRTQFVQFWESRFKHRPNNNRVSVSTWAKAKEMLGTNTEDEIITTLLPAVILALDEHLPGVANVVETQDLSIASVHALLSWWMTSPHVNETAKIKFWEETLLEKAMVLQPTFIIKNKNSSVVEMNDESVFDFRGLPPPSRALPQLTPPSSTSSKQSNSLQSYAHEIFMSGSMPNWKRYLKQLAGVHVEPMSNSDAGEVVHPTWYGKPLLAIDVVLRGVSQVYICDHPLSGIMLLIAVGLTDPYYVPYSLLGTISSTLGAMFALGGVEDAVFDGLYGYDGCLVGNAIRTFTVMTDYQFFVVIVLSLLTGIFRVAIAGLLSRIGMPAFTISFNLVTGIFLSALLSDTSRTLELSSSPPPIAETFTGEAFVEATIKGVGQFIFADTWAGSVLVILSILLCSWSAASGGVAGSAVAAVTAVYLVRVPPTSRAAVRIGLYGYNAVGCCASFCSGLFVRRTLYNALIGIACASASVYMIAGWGSFMKPLPVLTLPFVTTTYIFLFARKVGISVREERNKKLAGK